MIACRSVSDARTRLTLALVGGLVGCSACSSQPEARSVVEGGVDARSGAGNDAGWADVVAAGASADACALGPLDGGPFARYPFVGSWSSIPGAPACCPAVMALQPALSISAWTWSPCASGRIGCRVLNVDWTTNPGRSISFRETESVRLVQGQPYLTYSRVYPVGPLSLGDFSAYIDVVQPIDGAPVFAIGLTADPVTHATGCGFWTTFGEAGIGLLGGPNDPTTNFLSWAPWSSPTSIRTKILSNADLGIGPLGNAQAAVLGSQFYVETLGPNSVDVFDLATQKVIIPNTPQRLPGEAPRAVADGALVLDYTTPYSVDLLRTDGSYLRLIAPISPHVVTSLALERSNGDAMVWVESDDQLTYVNSVIWTAPYTTDPASLARRKVALIGNDTLHHGGAGMVANRGVALNLIGSTTALLTRLSDGVGWTIAAEPGRPFVWPVWVDDNEVWLTTADGSLKEFQTYQSGVVRIARSTLGAPNVTRGF